MHGRQRYCNSCAVAKRADQLRAEAAAKVILENTGAFKAEHPEEWAEMMAEAEAGRELSDAKAWELLTAVKEVDDEALRRMVEGEE